MKIQRSCICLAAALMIAGCGKEDHSSKPTSSSGGNPVTAPLDYIAAVGHAQQRAVKSIDLSYLNHDIQLFQAQEGRFPKDLNELVTMQYSGKLPQAPYGMKIVYDATQGKVSVVKDPNPPPPQ